MSIRKEWQARATKEGKGKAPTNKITPEGIEIKPVYLRI